VSALGHYLEEEGIATVAISLIRPQTENTRPPRALWVPFELGRPFGPPGDGDFQRRVIVAALGMPERSTGPVTIEDFAEDDPRERPDPAWRPPLAADAARSLADEIAALEGAYRRSVTARGRSTVGLSGLPIAEVGRYIAAWLDGANPESPVAGMSAPLALRFAADDLKAYCLEAALAGAGRPSSRQQADWLWQATAAGAALIALRRAHVASPDERLKLIAGNFLVPALRVPPQVS
jgi:hypothetical protein